MAWRRDGSSCCSLQGCSKYTYIWSLSFPTALHSINRDHSTWYQNSTPHTVMYRRACCCCFSIRWGNNKLLWWLQLPPKLAQPSHSLPACMPRPVCNSWAEKRGLFLGRHRFLQRTGSSVRTDPTVQHLGISNSSSSSRKLSCQTWLADSASSDISIFSKYIFPPWKYGQGPNRNI